MSQILRIIKPEIIQICRFYGGHRVYYDNSSEWNHRQGPLSQDSKGNGDNYYGIKGVRRVSNVTIAFLCLVVSAIGLSLQLLAVSKSVVFRRDLMLAESGKMQEAYNKIRSDASSKDRKEQILAFEQKFGMKDSDTEVKLQS